MFLWNITIKLTLTLRVIAYFFHFSLYFFTNSSTQSDDKQINYKMDELEKKIKNEV